MGDLRCIMFEGLAAASMFGGLCFDECPACFRSPARGVAGFRMLVPRPSAQLMSGGVGLARMGPDVVRAVASVRALWA